jgi:hypothetical protein
VRLRERHIHEALVFFNHQLGSSRQSRQSEY